MKNVISFNRYTDLLDTLLEKDKETGGAWITTTAVKELYIFLHNSQPVYFADQILSQRLLTLKIVIAAHIDRQLTAEEERRVERTIERNLLNGKLKPSH